MKYFILLFSIIYFQPCFIIAQGKSSSTTIKAKKTDSTPIKTIQNFLDWYKRNYKTLYKYSMTYSDSLGNYRVNIKDCTNYFSSLTSSGCISEEYVRLWSDYCLSQDQKFMISPQNEGPPEGFDMDLVLHTQEPDEVTKHFMNFKYITEKSAKSEAIVLMDTGWPDWIYVFELSKIKGRWYIDYISLKEPD